MPISYKTVEGSVEAEIVEKKSRFISHLSHAEDEDEALEFIERIREENSQARHNVYAYLLRDGRTRYSDDGEPSQTSGLPTFEALQHAGLSDAVIVTTRYFGGILLGTGGLVRAYTKAAQTAIERARIVEVCTCVDLAFEIPYALNSSIQKVIEASPAAVVDCLYTDVVAIRLRTREEDSSKLYDNLLEATRGQIPIRITEPKLATL